jgi:hypothetical protein
VAHYTVFGHRLACDSPGDCAQAACSLGIDSSRPNFFQTGLSERPGNDVIITHGGSRDMNHAPPAIAQGGTFMHELGHNLGLDHGGPMYVGGVLNDTSQIHLNYKPNYLSVMNYSHQSVGIGTASASCAANDYTCKTTAVRVRLDYASFAAGFIPNTLDENSGTEAAGINVGNDIGYASSCSGARVPIAGTGPVDFNCDGTRNQTWCASGCDITPGMELNNDPAGLGGIPDGSGSGDILKPFEDWPNLFFRFQTVTTTFASGAPAQPAAPAKKPE